MDARPFRVGAREVLVADSGDAEADAERRAGLGAVQAGKLPTVKHTMRDSVAFENTGELVNIIDRKSVAPIDTKRTIVGEAGQVVDADEIAISSRDTEGVRPRIGQTKSKSTRELAVKADLHGIKIRARAFPVDRDVAVSRIRPQEIPIIGIRAQQRGWIRGDLRRILVLWKESGSVRNCVQVQLIEKVAALRSDVGRVQDEFVRQFVLNTEAVVHHRRNLAVVVQTKQTAGAKQGASRVDAGDQAIEQSGGERRRRIRQLVEDLIAL